jgi:hypothetical protein
MLINGMKFGIRVWVLLTSVNPLRVYMHSGGLVLFSTDMYTSDITREDGSVAGVRKGSGSMSYGMSLYINFVSL